MTTRIRIGRNDKCPCKSGKKFKNCCLPKQYPHKPPPTKEQLEAEQQAREAVQAARRHPMAAMVLADRMKEFRKRFGREPGPSDRIFFENVSQQDVIEKISQAMTAAGIDQAHIHAFRKTGLIVVSENMDFLTGEELMKWTVAVDEYRAEHASGEKHEQSDLDSHQ